MAAATAVTARSSGTNAASSAPKARTRITSVIGSDVNSAFWKSSSNAWDSALSALPSPNCSMRKSACRLSRAATASSDGSIRVLGVLARYVEGHERRAAVLGALPRVVPPVGAVHVPHVPGGLEPGHDVRHHAAELRVAGAGAVLALDEDALVGVLGEVLRGDLVGTPGLADAEVGVVERPGSDRAADEHGGDHEGEPAEDRLLPVVRAPAARARCEVSRGVHENENRATRARFPFGLPVSGGSVIRTPAAPPAPRSPSAASRACSAGTSSSRRATSSSPAGARRG